MQHVAGVQQCFGRDAAHVEAGATERVASFDAGHFQPQLRATDRADIAAGAGTDDDDVVVGHWYDPFNGGLRPFDVLGALPQRLSPLPRGIFPRRSLEERCEEHDDGCQKSYGPDDGPPRCEPLCVGWNVEDPRNQVCMCAEFGQCVGLSAEFDHEHGDGEEDQCLKVVVHGPDEPAGGWRDLFNDWFSEPVRIARPHRFALSQFEVRWHGHQKELHHLEKRCEGKDCEFCAHVVFISCSRSRRRSSGLCFRHRCAVRLNARSRPVLWLCR